MTRNENPWRRSDAVRNAIRVFITAAILAITALPSVIGATMVGNIAGRVTDTDGNPLVNASVFVEGESFGDATDADGNYFMLQIPPGTYAIIAYQPGFRSIRRSRVRVYADRTVRLDYELPIAGIEIEPETRPAVPPIIKPDITSTRYFILPSLYRSQPVQNFSEAIAHEPGIETTATGEFTVRGADPSEIGFTVDGIGIVNPMDDRPYTSVNVALVEQVQVLTGAYPAASGGSFSVVNIVAREPSRMPWIVVDGRIVPAQRKHYGVSAYSNDQYDRLLYLNNGRSTNGRLFNVTAFDAEGNPAQWTDDVNSDLPVYRVRTDADIPESEPIFAGWNEILSQVNSGARSLGDSLIQTQRGNWTVETLRAVWDHRHRAWDYAGEHDYYLDAALSTPMYILPRTNLTVGYKHEQTSLVVPAVVQSPTSKTLEALLRSTVIPRVTFETYGRFALIRTTADGTTTDGLPGFGTSELDRFYGIADPTQDVLTYTGSDLLSTVQDKLADHGGESGQNKYNLWSNIPYEEMVWGGGARMRHAVTNRFSYTFGYDYLRGEVDARTSGHRGTNSNSYHTDAYFDLVQLPNDDVVFLDESPWGYSPGSYTGLDLTGAYYLAGGGNVSDFSHWESHRGYASTYSQATATHGVTLGADYSLSLLHRDTRIANRETGEDAAFVQYDAEPWEFAIFAQDKMEYDGLIANIGVRVEGFNAGETVIYPGESFPDAYAEGGFASVSGVADPDGLPSNGTELLTYLNGSLEDDPGWQHASQILDVVPQEESRTYWRVSPRIGVSHPAGTNMRIFFSFGRLHVAPETGYRYGYYESGQRLGNAESTILGTGNPNLEPTRRTIYEAGAERSFARMFAFRLRGYSGTDEKLPSQVTYVGERASVMNGGPSSDQVVYSTYDNTGYRTFRGLESVIEKSEGEVITWSLSADIQEVSDSAYGTRTVYENAARDGASPLDRNRVADITPTARGYMRIGTPPEWGPITGNWGIGMEHTYRRGSRLLYYPSGAESDPIAFRWVDTWRTNVRAEKTFRLENGSISVYADVRNVFDIRTFNLGAVDYERYFEDVLMEGGDKPLHRIGDFGYTVNGEDVRDIVERRLVREDDWLLYLYPRSYQLGLRVNF